MYVVNLGTAVVQFHFCCDTLCVSTLLAVRRCLPVCHGIEMAICLSANFFFSLIALFIVVS